MCVLCCCAGENIAREKCQQKMLGSKSFELIKDLDRNPITIPAFNDDLVRQVIVEIQDIYAANSRDA